MLGRGCVMLGRRGDRSPVPLRYRCVVACTSCSLSSCIGTRSCACSCALRTPMRIDHRHQRKVRDGEQIGDANREPRGEQGKELGAESELRGLQLPPSRRARQTDRGGHREPPELVEGGNKGRSGTEGNHRKAGREAERPPRSSSGGQLGPKASKQQPNHCSKAQH